MSCIQSDCAFYQAEVLAWYEENGKKYKIISGMDRRVRESIKTIIDWKALLSPEGEDRGRVVGTAIRIMNRTEKAFRLVVQRWRNEWQLLDSFTLSKFEGNISTNYRGTWGFRSAFDNPNWFANRY
jgi:transposase